MQQTPLSGWKTPIICLYVSVLFATLVILHSTRIRHTCDANVFLSYHKFWSLIFCRVIVKCGSGAEFLCSFAVHFNACPQIQESSPRLRQV